MKITQNVITDETADISAIAYFSIQFPSTGPASDYEAVLSINGSLGKTRNAS